MSDSLSNHIKTDDSAISRIYVAIKHVDNRMASLKKASYLSKADEAELYAEAVRQCLMHMALALHGLKNDLQRLQGEKVPACTLP